MAEWDLHVVLHTSIPQLARDAFFGRATPVAVEIIPPPVAGLSCSKAKIDAPAGLSTTAHAQHRIAVEMKRVIL